MHDIQKHPVQVLTEHMHACMYTEVIVSASLIACIGAALRMIAA